MAGVDFFERKAFCLFGMSRNKSKFGNALHAHLTRHGYRLYPVHPEAVELFGVRCYREPGAVPEPVDGAIICLPPAQALGAVRACAEAGIREVFLQQGSDSEQVLALCGELGLHAYYRSCAILCSKPTGFHSVHAFFARLFGSRPRELLPSDRVG
jgi:predicted CoA-binding protein